MWSITKHLEDHADKQRDRSNPINKNNSKIWCSKFIKLNFRWLKSKKRSRALSFQNDSAVGLHSLRDSLSNPDLCVQTIFLQKVSVDDRHNNSISPSVNEVRVRLHRDRVVVVGHNFFVENAETFLNRKLHLQLVRYQSRREPRECADDSSRVGHAERETRCNTWPARCRPHVQPKKERGLCARESSTRVSSPADTHTCWAAAVGSHVAENGQRQPCITRAPLTFQPGRAHLFGRRSLLPAHSRGKKQRDTK